MKIGNITIKVWILVAAFAILFVGIIFASATTTVSSYVTSVNVTNSDVELVKEYLKLDGVNCEGVMIVNDSDDEYIAYRAFDNDGNCISVGTIHRGYAENMLRLF